MKTYRILAVDDDEQNLKSTRCFLELWGYEVDTTTSPVEALARVMTSREAYAVVLLDYRMPTKNGAELSREIRAINQDSVILVYSGDPSRDALKFCMQSGAVDFVEKDDDVEKLRKAIERACKQFEDCARVLKSETLNTGAADLIASVGLVGRSMAMAEIARKTLRYRKVDDHVLITGESGVGKEPIARALSNGGKFLAVNCAAFKDSTSMVESELFGYEKGSFTGAVNRKAGLLESAGDGTVFLDELHTLSLDSQQKVLRALQEKKIRRMGGNEEYPIKCRIVAACKPDIEQRLVDGSFLADLYYRLDVLRIDIPTLRERAEDIAPLVAHFCDRYNKKHGTNKSFLVKTVKLMEQYEWPGNVRELENMISKLCTDTDGPIIGPAHLPPSLKKEGQQSESSSFSEFESRQERERLQFLLAGVRGKTTVQAAKDLGLPRTTLKSMLERYGLQRLSIQ